MGEARDQLLEPGILALKLLKASGLFDLKATILLAPPVVSLFGNLRLLAGHGGFSARRYQHVNLATLGNDLLRSKSFLRRLSDSLPC